MKVRMISITRHWLWLVLVAAFAGPAAAAGPNFSTSTASHEPVKVIAGDVVRYTVTVTNTGGAADYARLTMPLLDAVTSFAPTATVPPPSATAIELFGTRGRSRPARRRQCRIDFLGRRQAAGTLAPLVTEIWAHPSGSLRVETRP